MACTGNKYRTLGWGPLLVFVVWSLSARLPAGEELEAEMIPHLSQLMSYAHLTKPRLDRELINTVPIIRKDEAGALLDGEVLPGEHFRVTGVSKEGAELVHDTGTKWFLSDPDWKLKFTKVRKKAKRRKK